MERQFRQAGDRACLKFAHILVSTHIKRTRVKGFIKSERTRKMLQLVQKEIYTADSFTGQVYRMHMRMKAKTAFFCNVGSPGLFEPPAERAAFACRSDQLRTGL